MLNGGSQVVGERVCEVEGCERKHQAMGLCGTHYKWSLKGKSLDTPIKIWQKRYGCTVEGCERKHKAKGLCETHYGRQRKRMSLDAPIRSQQKRAEVCDIEGM